MAVKAIKDFKEILLEEKFLIPEQLKKAEEIQRISSESLGNILVRMGILTEIQLAKVQALQWGIPYVDLDVDEKQLNLDIIKTIPQHLALRHKIIAVDKRENKLIVAMSDPLNVIAVDDLRLVTGLEIEPVLSTSEAIQRAIVQNYGIRMGVTEMIAEEEVKVTEEELKGLETGEDVDMEELKKLVDEAPVVKLVSVIITRAIRDKSSDIHIEPLKRELRIRYRIDGILHDVMSPPKGIQPVLISRVKIMAGMDISERRIPQDGRIQLIVEGKEFDFRVSTYPTIFGEKVVMRILDKSGVLIGLNKLGLQSQTQAMLEELVENPYGILLSTGPTGSGKTTTLYSCLNKLNTIEKNIITIEDPIEYQLDGVNQIQVNEKAGLVFALGLRHILRQDPDIVMVGEIRDRETAEIAINAALTGHLVLSTLHTNDAPGATTRLIDMGIESYLVASSLVGVLAQRLARTICPHCKESYQTPSDALKKFGVYLDEPTVTLYRGAGCERCRNTGYLGRTGIFELMYVSEDIRRLVINKEPASAIKEVARKEGMKTLQEDCIDKVLAGITTIEESIRIIFVEE